MDAWTGSRAPHGHGGPHLVVLGHVEWLVGFTRLRSVNSGSVTSNHDDILTSRRTFSTYK